MASWRVARSLDLLLAQINDSAPRRSKTSDGSIGDLRHQASKSDHNPNSRGHVTARDFTHDPAGGFDAHAFADRLLASRDPRIKYIISKGRIGSSYVSGGVPAWRWRPYHGSNGHYKHAHVSVHGDYDSVTRWAVAGGGGSLDLGDRTLFLDDPQMGGADVADAAERLGLLEDADFAYFGPNMDRTVRAFQKANGLAEDGRLGPNTVAALKRGTAAVVTPRPAPTPPEDEAEPDLPPRGYRWDSGHDLTRHDQGTASRHGGLVKWQSRMRDRGWKNSKGHPFEADGYFGDETERVVRLFQKAKGLKVDGRIGENTWNAAWTEEVV